MFGFYNVTPKAPVFRGETFGKCLDHGDYSPHGSWGWVDEFICEFIIWLGGHRNLEGPLLKGLGHVGMTLGSISFISPVCLCFSVWLSLSLSLSLQLASMRLAVLFHHMFDTQPLCRPTYSGTNWPPWTNTYETMSQNKPFCLEMVFQSILVFKVIF